MVSRRKKRSSSRWVCPSDRRAKRVVARGIGHPRARVKLLHAEQKNRCVCRANASVGTRVRRATVGKAGSRSSLWRMQVCLLCSLMPQWRWSKRRRTLLEKGEGSTVHRVAGQLASNPGTAADGRPFCACERALADAPLTGELQDLFSIQTALVRAHVTHLLAYVHGSSARSAAWWTHHSSVQAGPTDRLVCSSKARARQFLVGR